MAIPKENLTDKGFDAAAHANSSGEDVSFDKDPRDLSSINNDHLEDEIFEIDDFEIDSLQMK